MAGRTTIAGRCAVLWLWLTCCIASPSALQAQQIDQDAFVYILNMGIKENKIVYRGLRVGFAVGDGRTVLTAAHCVEDFRNDNFSLFKPLIISRYYGDIFEADIIDTDDANDIALLKPTWDSHPMLRINSGNQWKQAKRVVIAGYKPSYQNKGKTTQISHNISLNYEKVVQTNGKGRHALQLGSVNYPGKGWSGSAFVLPDSGEVIGILSNERYVRRFFLKRHYIFGCNPEAIQSLFQRNDLPLSVFTSPVSRRDGTEQFDSILKLFDSFLVEDKEKSYRIVKELCRKHPDSYIIQLIAAWILKDPSDEQHFRRSVDLASNRAFPNAAYGSYLLNHDRPKQALRRFQNAVFIDPNYIFAQTGRIVALTQIDPAEAEEQARELIRKWPSNATFWFDLSRALRKQHKFKQELPILRMAIELPYPERLRFLYLRHLADSLANNKRYAEAEQTYKTLFKVHTCARCWLAYTSLLIRMGPERAEDARRAFENVKAMNKDNDISKETIRKFEKAIRIMEETSISSR